MFYFLVFDLIWTRGHSKYDECFKSHENMNQKLRNACGLRRLMHSVNNDGRGRRSLRRRYIKNF